MNQENLRKYIRKLVKEAIVKETKGTVSVVAESKQNKKILVIKESKKVIKNEQYAKVLKGRKALIESMISEKGIMDKLGGMFGKVDPSLDVDSPEKVVKTINNSITKAKKIANDFSTKALNTTSSINMFHDAVLDALDKWARLSDSAPDQKDVLEKQVVELARQFYQSLKSEKERIDSFLKTITADMADKGFHQSMMTSNPKVKKNSIEEPGRVLKNKEDVPPMNSLGKSISDLATDWIK